MLLNPDFHADFLFQARAKPWRSCGAKFNRARAQPTDEPNSHPNQRKLAPARAQPTGYLSRWARASPSSAFRKDSRGFQRSSPNLSPAAAPLPHLRRRSHSEQRLEASGSFFRSGWSGSSTRSTAPSRYRRRPLLPCPVSPPRPRWLDAAITFSGWIPRLAAPQKRKLLDEGLERKREEQLKELYDGEARPLNFGWIMWGRAWGQETVYFSLHFDSI
jgi:hypothetical protein